MLAQVSKVVRDIVGIRDLRWRIFVTFMLLIVYRLGFHIYLPYVDLRRIEDRLAAEGQGGFLQWIGYASALTGGNLHNATLFSLGIMPYITASIIFSLLVKVIPRLEALSKEGEHGRRAINRYTRYATVLVAIVQGAFVVFYLRTPFGQEGFQVAILYDGHAWWNAFTGIVQLLTLILGAVFLMWVGEKIGDFGIGNGSSVLIMAGIISRMPSAFWWMYNEISSAGVEERPFKMVWASMIILLFIAIVVGVVFITRGQRRIPIQQARTVKGRRVYGGAKHYMPLRVNSAGVMPIIFAQALVVLPPKLIAVAIPGLDFLNRYFTPGAFWYYVLYVALIIFFSYFWTSLMYNPSEIANNIKEHGSFIPGIRPGRRTAEYLERIMNRITLAGCVFLAIIALVPEIVRGSLDVDYEVASLLGGTSMLIIVGVALDVVDKTEAQLLVRQYDGFVRGSGE
jgi:preprotein translocase subunit SecY